MNHGRSTPRPRRAPAQPLSDPTAARTRFVTGPNPFRIGPPAALTAADWHERGVRLECAGDPAAAISCYRTALSVGGPVAQIVFDLAYALASVGKIEAAIERYRQVLELDAARPDAWLNLGDLLLTAGETEAGLDAIRQAARLDPHDPVASYNLAVTVGDGQN